MNKIIIITMFILCLPFVLAIQKYGGETYTHTLEDCDNFTLDIVGNLTIDDGEYTIGYNCTEIDDDYWYCNCTNNTFKITYNQRTINYYHLTFNYNSTYTPPLDDDESSSSGSSGGGGGGGGGFASLGGDTIKSLFLKLNIYYRFSIKGKTHSIRMINITNSSAGFIVESEPIKFNLEVTAQTQIDLDNDGKNDVWFKLKEIRGKVAVLELKEVSTNVAPEVTTPTKEPIEEPITEPLEEQPIQEPAEIIEEKGMSIWWKIAVFAFITIIIILIVAFFFMREDNEY